MQSAGLSIKGQALHCAIAHMLTPLCILKQPLTPQLAPQEFFTFQQSTFFYTPQPVASTAWLTVLAVVPQFLALQTPPAQFWNPEITSKAIEIGPTLQSLSASYFSSPWVMLQLPQLQQATSKSGRWLHLLVLATQGQDCDDWSPPVYLMYSNAWEGRPPLQPWLLKALAQSTSCCSEKVRFLPLPRMFQWASKAPTVEKVQHEPQFPWFLTGDTMPQSFHSQLSGI